MRSSMRALFFVAVSIALGACAGDDDGAKKMDEGSALASDAGTSAEAGSVAPDAAGPAAARPPGYMPPSLIPEGYNPPSLLALTPEQTLDAFRRIEDTYVTTTAKRGAKVFPLPAAVRQVAPVVSWRGKSYDDLGTFMTEARITGLLALKNGEIVLERYALGRTESDRWTSFSVGKSITSLLVGAAIQDGYIGGLEEPVTKYIPELAGSAYEGVTIRQLITMTSGVKWNEDYADPNSDVALSSFWPGEPGVNPLVSYMRRLPRAAEPGTLFAYKTGETDMAGILVANATGRGLSQYLSEKIWAPYGMEADAVWIVDGGSIERGGCCISMTLRDYGRLGLFVSTGAMAAGKRVVSEAYLTAATSNQIMPPAVGNYGYFWWIGAGGNYAARGIFGQSIQIIPSKQLVIVTNSAFPLATSQEYSEAVSAVTTAIATASD